MSRLQRWYRQGDMWQGENQNKSLVPAHVWAGCDAGMDLDGHYRLSVSPSAQGLNHMR